MNKLLIIGGPTGIGKSELAVKLAKRYNAVILSADSAQIYKGMNIGTGKITESEKCGILHTMIDIVNPNEDYSVQNYCNEAKKIISQLHIKNRLPIVVGGTGLYINALINEQNFADAKPDYELRERLRAICDEKGAAELHAMLQAVDKQSAEKIPVNDVKRTIRALEIHSQTGKSKSQSVTQKTCPYDVKFFIPEMDRTKLYERINLRTDAMIENGLYDEVLSLKPFWECRSMQAIGYKEVIASIKQNISCAETAEIIKQNSRKYAKRQITFFKWISSEKTYVSENFFENTIKITDEWLNGN